MAALGAAGVFFFIPQNYIQRTLLAFVLAGMSAGLFLPLGTRGFQIFVSALVPTRFAFFAYGGDGHMSWGA
jgi:hypothetical protein